MRDAIVLAIAGFALVAGVGIWAIDKKPYTQEVCVCKCEEKK